MLRTISTLTLALLGLGLAHCSQDIAAPTAAAGPEQQVAVGDVVQLDGSASRDPDDLRLGYHWSFVALPAGSAAELNDPSVVNPSFRADRAGEYRVALVVSNGSLSSDPSLTLVVAGPCGAQPPQIDELRATPEQPGVGATVQLSATVHDPDLAAACGGDGEGLLSSVAEEGQEPGAAAGPALFAWRMVAQPAGSEASLNDPGVRNPSLLADVPGEYRVELVVTDATGLASAPQELAFTVSGCGGASPVVAELQASPATPDVGSLVQLSATVSDADGDDPCGLTQGMFYEWALLSLPPGSQAELNDAQVESPSFVADEPGRYLVALTVRDATERNSETAYLEIETSACHSAAPSVDAIAITPEQPGVGEPVQLAATVSDTDQDIEGCEGEGTFRYAWRIVALPAGSRAVLNAPTAANPSFVPDVAGEYSLGLVVQDAFGRSSAEGRASFAISECGGQAPVARILVAPAQPQSGALVSLVAWVLDPDAGDGLADALETRLGLDPDSADSDQDGIADVDEQGEGDEARDSDEDTIPDALDDDSDADGVSDLDEAGDGDLLTPPADSDGDGVPDYLTQDSDGDGVADADDLCRLVPDPDQADSDGDGRGDACQEDFDGDGWVDAEDNCPNLANPTQADRDGNGAGDRCDSGVVLTDGCDRSEALTYAWAFEALPAGSTARLLAAASRTPSFVADLPGEYRITLTVSDSTGLSSRRELLVLRVGPCGNGRPSIAALSSDPEAPATGQVVQLAALVDDPDADPAGCGLTEAFRYLWQLDALPAGSRAALNAPEAANPSLLADRPGQYVVGLRVVDRFGNVSERETLTFEVSPCGDAAPTAAVAVEPAAPLTGQRVRLVATPADADLEAPCGLAQTFAYRWTLLSVPEGSQASLHLPESSSPSFVAERPGLYALELVVTDSTGRESLPIPVEVAVDECGSHAPVVDAVLTTPAAPGVGDLVQLEPSVTDADTQDCGLQQAMDYHWSFLAMPAGSQARFNDATLRGPSFVPDLPGAYDLLLRVQDGTGRFGERRLSVAVAECGGANPVIVALRGLPDAQPFVGETTQLAAEVSDADEAPACGRPAELQYSWSFVERPAGSSATLNGAALASPSFAADLPGLYRVRLVVSDETGRRSAPSVIDLEASECGGFAPVIDELQASPSPAPNTGQVVGLSYAATDADQAAPCSLPQTLRPTWSLIELPAGSTARLNAPNADTPSFVADLPGTYVVGLALSDDTGRAALPARLVVEAQPCGAAAPSILGVRVDGPAPAVGTWLALAADVDDADISNPGCGLEQTLTYAWTLRRLPQGSQAVINDPQALTPSIYLDQPGDYSVELVVSDDTGRSARASLDFPVGVCGSAAPVIDEAGFRFEPGPPQIGQALQLSVPVQDPDQGCLPEEQLSYRWRMLELPAGSQAALNDAGLASPSFVPDAEGRYRFDLEVEDSSGHVAHNRLPFEILVGPCGGQVPQARILVLPGEIPCNDQELAINGGLLQVDARDSSDPDAACGVEQELSYRWELLAAPAGSQAELSLPTALNPWFRTDVSGEYVLRLWVSDGIFESDPSTCTLRVAAQNNQNN